MWFAVADPALIPTPYDQVWILKSLCRCRGLANAMIVARQKQPPGMGTPPRRDQVSLAPCGERSGVGAKVELSAHLGTPALSPRAAQGRKSSTRHRQRVARRCHHSGC
jgi:hypothetical protein